MAGPAEAVAVAVRVERDGVRRLVVVGDTVAVGVDVVADLGGARVDDRVGVVAVDLCRYHVARRLRARLLRLSYVAVAVAVRVEEPHRRLDGVVVDALVAVVVDAVALDLDPSGVDVGVAVVAVGLRRHEDVARETRDASLGSLEGVAIAVRVECPLGLARGVGSGVRTDAGTVQPLVDPAVAVVVDCVAGFWRARADLPVRVVAVLRCRHAVKIGVVGAGAEKQRGCQQATFQNTSHNDPSFFLNVLVGQSHTYPLGFTPQDRSFSGLAKKPPCFRETTNLV